MVRARRKSLKTFLPPIGGEVLIVVKVGAGADAASGRLRLQIALSPLRPHFVKASVQVRRYADMSLAQ